ncbi:MAG: arginine--tRNA ligase [Ruminococcus sp.]|nr:arginine--tRNA ligase [Ruminococcus sp.]
MNMIEEAKNQVREIISAAVNSLFDEGKLQRVELPKVNVEIPADSKNGDMSSNFALAGARIFRKSPRDIATLIKEAASLEGSYFEKMEIAGAGFINFYYSATWFAKTVSDIISQGESYGSAESNGKRVLIEYVSANPTGPMHIGNARGGAIGDCLASVMEKAGWEVDREFYVNDAGNQIEKFKTSLECRYLSLYKEGIEMPEDSYHGEDIIEHAKNYADIYGDKLLNVSSEERRQELCDFALPKNIEGLERDLKKYRIVYDKWFKESELHQSGAVDEILEKLKQSGYTYTQGGALWFKSSELGDEKDRVLVRENGIPTYFVPDIAYHYNKLVTRGYDKAIDILGADHHGYIPRMKAAMAALGVDADKLDMVIMQMVNLVKDGERYKLSKRSGKAITLSTLLDEIPIDAARFFFNLREPDSHFDFDIDLAISETSQNPVYYVQYAHARICSILKGLKEEGIQIAEGVGLELLTTPEETELIKHLAELPDCILESAKDYDPSKVTRYAVETATLYHKFYSSCRVKCDDEKLMLGRISLCLAVKQVIKNVLDMLKITCPEHM